MFHYQLFDYAFEINQLKNLIKIRYCYNFDDDFFSSPAELTAILLPLHFRAEWGWD
jgi:hypothetical protein